LPLEEKKKLAAPKRGGTPPQTRAECPPALRGTKKNSGQREIPEAGGKKKKFRAPKPSGGGTGGGNVRLGMWGMGKLRRANFLPHFYFYKNSRRSDNHRGGTGPILPFPHGTKQKNYVRRFFYLKRGPLCHRGAEGWGGGGREGRDLGGRNPPGWKLLFRFTSFYQVLKVVSPQLATPGFFQKSVGRAADQTSLQIL